MGRRALPVRNRSAPCAISSGRVPGKPLSRSVRPCQPEPSSAAIPGTPPFSKWTMRIGFLLVASGTLPPPPRFLRGGFHPGEPPPIIPPPPPPPTFPPPPPSLP